MKNWHDVIIDTTNADDIERLIIEHENYNPACKLIKYWKERMYNKMIPTVKSDNKLVYGFVGDGWPIKLDQIDTLKYDKLNLHRAYKDIHYRDVGDAIYQANRIIEMLPATDKLYIMDIGSGYGRLAVPFLYHFKDRICYVGVDYSVPGLLIAPQFISQTTKARVRYYNDDSPIEEFQFISLPAWKLQDVSHIKFNVFVSIHSFQEMEMSSIKFYVDFMDKVSNDGALFYNVNLPPEFEVKWKLIYNKDFPVNRDGSYNEKIWRK